ncbi:MAG: universal stress protein [Dehalococcoidales bacterium]|nr:universal stress protein [Dehalococcoidales bacterium]
MYEKILVPLDGSQIAEVALPYAEELAVRLGSEVTLLYVNEQNDDSYRHMHEFYMEKTVEAVKHDSEAYAQNSGKPTPVRVRATILSGNPAERIVEYADKENIGLIVMSTHGRSGIKHWTIGSVAEKVVRATSKPVALIRAKGTRPAVREKGLLTKILVPLDGSKEGETAIPYAEELSSRLKAEITFLQVLATGYQAMTESGGAYIAYSESQMESFKRYALTYLNPIAVRLKNKGISTKVETRLGDSAEEIISLAGESKADVVIMSTHGRSGFSRWVFGSVADKLIHGGNTPLILVRMPAK